MRIYIRRNGTSNGQVINCPDNFQSLLELCQKDVAHPVLFSNSGDVITSVEVIRDNDIIYVAEEGEKFKSEISQATNRAKAFATFTARKQEEREQFFKRTSTMTSQQGETKGKGKRKNSSETCKLTIGMMEWKCYKKRGKKEPKLVFRKQVGQQMTVSVSVNKDASVSTLIDSAIAAFKLVDPDVDSSVQYVLLYSNLKSKVEFLPQSKEVFTPRKCVELVGTFYSKLRLYLVSKDDWIASTTHATKYQRLRPSCKVNAKNKKGDPPVPIDEETHEDLALVCEEPSIEQLREYRLSHLLGNSSSGPPQNATVQPDVTSDGGYSERSYEQKPPKVIDVHRSHICRDLIKHFKKEDVMQSDLVFEIINDMGHKENGVGEGVDREVYTSFWKEFANSFTIGERERVPFIMHDHFIQEWEAVGRILVKGYKTVCYYPMFIAKAFIAYCLFEEDVSDSMILESFLKYLSPEEEESIDSYIGEKTFPDENDELMEFLDGFKCRSLITPKNFTNVIVELAKQELIQKPHVMLACFKPIVKELKQFEPFKTLQGIEEFYDEIKPTTKKVLQRLNAKPVTDGERDALQFLKRYIRGLDNSKLNQFLRFTTACDIMMDKPIEVTFIKLEGLASRPIAHTCGPLLELPSTYSNFVELREQFNNIFEQKSWEIDIL